MSYNWRRPFNALPFEKRIVVNSVTGLGEINNCGKDEFGRATPSINESAAQDFQSCVREPRIFNPRNKIPFLFAVQNIQQTILTPFLSLIHHRSLQKKCADLNILSNHISHII